MEVIGLNLTKRNQENQLSKPQIEGDRLYNRRLLLHDFDQGQPSSLILGQPGSCKTAVTAQICEHSMTKHPEDRIFWRSALNAPVQIVKLPKWHIYIENNSGIRFFNRRTGEDHTDVLIKQKKISYFKSFDDLYNKAKPGVCNGVFFKDMHMKGIKKDNGTLRWFRFIRFLLNKFDWCQVFLDEYQEMVKSGNGDRMYWEIDRHSDDVSSARKTHVGIHANCHQTAEIDWRVLPSFMLTLQLFGSRPYKYNMVTKQALAGLKEPIEQYGAEAWIAEGGKFGKIVFPKVYKLDGLNIAARIVSEYEHTKQCPICHHIFVYNRVDQIYCGNACTIKAHRKRKSSKKKSDTKVNETDNIFQESSPLIT